MNHVLKKGESILFKEISLTTGSLKKVLLIFALPLFLSQLFRLSIIQPIQSSLVIVWVICHWLQLEQLLLYLNWLSVSVRVLARD